MIGTGFAVASALGAAGQLASGIMSAQSRQGEFAEQLRRLKLKKDQTVGLAAARSGASGVEFSSASTQQYLASLTDEFDLGISRLKSTASMTGIMDLIGNFSSLLGAGASASGALGKANNWWDEGTD